MGLFVANVNKPIKDCKVREVNFGVDRTKETKKRNQWTLAEGKRNSILAESIVTPRNSSHIVGQTVISSTKGTPKRQQVMGNSVKV